jgi:hypothetical protein
MAGRGRGFRAQRCQRHEPGNRRCRRHAQCAHGAAEGLRCRGFVFYTNFDSAKGRELLATPKAALCFHWKSLRRQVRLRGHRDGERRGGRRLFRQPAARQPHRGVGVEAVAAARKPLCAGKGRGQICRPLRRVARCRDPPAGRGSASSRSPSSSGTTGRSACMSAWCFPGRGWRRRGARPGFIPDALLLTGLGLDSAPRSGNIRK